MRIKEILKTDSLAGSRIVLNSNFKNIKAEIADIDKFYEFDEESQSRIGIKTPLLKCNEINVETIKNLSGKSTKICQNNLECVAFNEDGDLLIRKDGNCDLNVRQALEDLSSTRMDNISEQVTEASIENEDWMNSCKTTLLSDADFIKDLIRKFTQDNNFSRWVSEQ